MIAHLKKRHLQSVERDLRGLDPEAWAVLKARVPPLLKKHPTRVWQPLYDTLNKAKRYNHLVRIGCTGVRFIPTVAGAKLPTWQRQRQKVESCCVT